MWPRFTILFITTFACVGAIAGTIPLQLYSTETWTVIPYTSDTGEERATFFYSLDADSSRFLGGGGVGLPNFDISGVLTVDVAQSVQPGELTNRIEIGFTLLDSNEFTSTAFWDFSGPVLLDSLRLYASDEALVNGQGEYHLSGNPDYLSTGNLSFGTTLTNFGDAYPFICIECGFDMYFNFLYMDWSTGQLQLNVDDDRTQLLYGNDSLSGFGPYSWDLNLSVQSVPLPASVWFLLSGLAFLGFGKSTLKK